MSPSYMREVMEMALSALDLKPEDEAAKELALIIAEQIDIERYKTRPSARTIAELSAKLTTLMGELMMTPKARKAVKTLATGEADHEYDDAARILKQLQESTPK